MIMDRSDAADGDDSRFPRASDHSVIMRRLSDAAARTSRDGLLGDEVLTACHLPGSEEDHAQAVGFRMEYDSTVASARRLFDRTRWDVSTRKGGQAADLPKVTLLERFRQAWDLRLIALGWTSDSDCSPAGRGERLMLRPCACAALVHLGIVSYFTSDWGEKSLAKRTWTPMLSPMQKITIILHISGANVPGWNMIVPSRRLGVCLIALPGRKHSEGRPSGRSPEGYTSGALPTSLGLETHCARLHKRFRLLTGGPPRTAYV
jgi:hypothetical protein